MLGEPPARTTSTKRPRSTRPCARRGSTAPPSPSPRNATTPPSPTSRRRARSPPPTPTASSTSAPCSSCWGGSTTATHSFEDYLGQRSGDAAAYYLVAKNYALTGYAGLAVQNLQQAIALDERMRASARGDANFSDLASNPRFQELLRADTYRMPACGPAARRARLPGLLRRGQRTAAARHHGRAAGARRGLRSARRGDAGPGAPVGRHAHQDHRRRAGRARGAHRAADGDERRRVAAASARLLDTILIQLGKRQDHRRGRRSRAHPARSR